MTGLPNQTVCSNRLQTNICTSSGWQPTTSCVCPVTQFFTTPGVWYNDQIGPDQSGVTTLAACQSLCLSTPNCEMVTYDVAGQACKLKSFNPGGAGFNMHVFDPADNTNYVTWQNMVSHGNDIFAADGFTTEASCIAHCQNVPGTFVAQYQGSNNGSCWCKASSAANYYTSAVQENLP